jgi:hypothetical protein
MDSSFADVGQHFPRHAGASGADYSRHLELAAPRPATWIYAVRINRCPPCPKHRTLCFAATGCCLAERVFAWAIAYAFNTMN